MISDQRRLLIASVPRFIDFLILNYRCSIGWKQISKGVKLCWSASTRVFDPGWQLPLSAITLVSWCRGEITRICAYTSWTTLGLVSSKRSDCWSRHNDCMLTNYTNSIQTLLVYFFSRNCSKLQFNNSNNKLLVIENSCQLCFLFFQILRSQGVETATSCWCCERVYFKFVYIKAYFVWHSENHLEFSLAIF
jgi:hypothetical protein